MLPLQQAYEVKESVLAYIEATFRFKEEAVHNAFYSLVKSPDNGLFKGPYISLKTPFVKATQEEADAIPLTIRPEGFMPHRHQLLSFNRLSTQSSEGPKPTLLTTGTGSGKTECFLYPILDYCYQCNKNGNRKGVKVIIMYPMNALASDQAKRLAEIIYADERLRGVVTAGLFIGEGDGTKAHPTKMGEHNIIENRDKIVEEAPDILLTNFKMLDYALMQQRYRSLWEGNYGPENPMLRFLVLDELHTYDGAQGTDVANLIRRLKLKLHLPAHHLCPVGTSATIGSGEENRQRLIEYASDVFGEEFDDDSVICEDRVSIADFFSQSPEDYIPSEADLKTCDIKQLSVQDYIQQVRRVWLPGSANDPIAIGEGLKKLTIMRDLLSVTQSHIVTVEELIGELGFINVSFRRMAVKGYGQQVVETLLALVSEAKIAGGFPLLYLQIQLWQRELSGVVRYVQQTPEFTWRNSLDTEGRVALPIYFCRDCGASGWVTTKNATDTRFGIDISKVSQAFMHNEKEVMLINTATDLHKPIPDYTTETSVNGIHYVRTRDLTEVEANDPEAMKIQVCSRRRVKKNSGVQAFMKYCPECNANAICLVGGRTSTLSSVAISQLMSSDFDESDLSQRKVLTFTNSVQDAAHQAGFYEARTYRFLLRQSIQQYLKSLSTPISLTELQARFKEYWKEQLQGDEYYYRFLPTDLLSTVDLDQNYRDEKGEFTEAFKKEFDLRVDWEICAEFGLMAQRGRTLEKVGSSASYFDPEKLEEVFYDMKPWMQENTLGYVAEDKERFLHFLNGLLHRMRLRGAVDHPYFELYRNVDFKLVNLNWQYNKKHFLNKKFGLNVQFPKFVITKYNREYTDGLDITAIRNHQMNWYSQYFRVSLEGINSFHHAYDDVITDFYAQLMESLVRQGILNRCEAGEGNYAIRPEAIMIEAKVKHIKCENCQSMLCVAQHDTLSDGSQCLNYNCHGRYTLLQRKEDNYYKMVYNRDKAPRIYAHEHNGLLERGEREQLELDFKEHPRFNSINALSATSTLEMGIDIGTLNVVGNTAIPPKPGNFLQRIGRAGRKSGSALVLNYAHSDGAHDMFYFAEPLGMMEGEVQTPGCFLEAKDILRRHFFAFAIDTWTSEDENHRIPAKVELLGLNNSMLSEDRFAINQILLFVSKNQDVLLSEFRAQYPEKAKDTLDKLETIVRNGEFAAVIREEFVLLNNRLEGIRKRIGHLKHIIEGLQQSDPRVNELKMDLKPLGRELHNLLSSSVVEYMTNAGLLPNYAFPETGVKLEATVYKQKPQNDTSIKEMEPDVFEIVRPASSGIRDLAPGNKFYTHKYELEVSGVNTFDWNKSLGVYKYCSECDCIASEGTDWFDKNICPKCGSPTWNGSGNIHRMLRFTSARSNVKKVDATLDDRSDERDQKNYHIMKHYRFNQQTAFRSYGLRNVGFGIEFCPDMELMEVNYGPQMASQTQTEVNNTNVPFSGYIVCRECGKAITTESAKAEDCHYRFCHHKDVAYPPTKENSELFERTYLYRKTQTESIKVLLPVHVLDTEATVQMFKAGLELGMRYYYQSSPEHIRIDVYREKNLATNEFDNYLVIYDTIPGGTGYLSRLQSPEEFSKLLRIAYEKVRDCQCQRDGKDGCYHCILSYSNQYIQDKLSRERTEELFKKLVDELDNWEEIEGSIGTVTQSGVIEDSELERKFVIDMQNYCEHRAGWSWKKEPDAVGYHYTLEIKKGDRDLKYIVRPQYDLGTAQGVAIHTIADFQIICTKAMVNGVNINPDVIPQWAIYLDGYQFHANADCMRFYSDFQKREAIRRNTQQLMRSWVMTWADLELHEDVIGPGCDDLMKAPLSQFENGIGQCKNSFERLLFALQMVSLPDLRYDVYKYTICNMDPQQIVCPESRIAEVISNSLNGQFANEISESDIQNWRFYGRTTLLPHSSLMKGSAWVEPDAMSADTCINKVRYDYKLVDGLQVINDKDWNDFWRRYNLLQMFDNETDE